MICPTDKCTGCYACVNICPKKCIEMKEDNYGYIYPEINQNLCIHCNLCNKVCPVNHPIQGNQSQNAYASWALDEEQRKLSTSGGLATLVSKFVIENEGIVYGAAYENGEFQHIEINDAKELSKIRGSKYVHSYVNYSFRKIKNLLNQNTKVLFIGTPCQVAGLKSFLGKEESNLYTIDIVCHGVPSQKLLKEELKDFEPYDKVLFRDQNGFNLTVFNKGVVKKSIPSYKSLYYQAFLDSLTYRENCYTCPYANSKRVGDLTLGDFWGLGNLKSEKKDEDKGISLILVNTDKGAKLLYSVEPEVFLEERSLNEAIQGNSQLRHPSKLHKNRDVFLNQYVKVGFKRALEQALEYRSFKKKVKRMIMSSSLLMFLIKRIKH